MIIRFTEQRRKRVQSYYERGWTIGSMAEAEGVAEHTIRGDFRALGLRVNGPVAAAPEAAPEAQEAATCAP